MKQRVHEPLAETLRRPGAILPVSCYELGHQPLGLASPLGFLEGVGYIPDALDIAVERFDPEKAARARFVGISVPMHTALRLGVRVAEEVRRINPRCHICFYGLCASLNADYLPGHVADSVIGGEFETALGALVEALGGDRAGAVEGVHRPGQPAGPVLKGVRFPVPNRDGLPGLEKYARLERDGTRALVGYVEASRGCLHMCLHCPIPPVYRGRFFVVPKEIVLEDVRRLVRSGATHITFGDPFLGPLDQASFRYRWTHADPRKDRLHESVCPMVEEATRAEEDPALTFVRVRELAETMAGLACSESHRLEPLSGRRRPPRLTEPWFC